MKSPIRVSPYCQELCSKKIMISDGLPQTDADVLDTSGAVWCAVTQQILGPDRDEADPQTCRKGRECFRSPFEDLL
ncbi:MAG: hypothetical protein ACI841_004886 [Planctomycetota bacterium]|jgi:hypothetical protein